MAGLVRALRRHALESRGSLVVLAAPPGVKALVDVWGAVGGAFPLMRDLKRAFDPEGILNPGRFVGGL
jgi:glycolate oxidase FAD binding subunit